MPCIFALLTMLAAAMLGCGGEPRGDVYGTVTFNGQPIQAGMVSFEASEAVAPARNVPIRDGTYRACGESALVPGSYRVRITAGDLSATDPNAVVDQHARVEYIPLLPAAWNTKSRLSVNVRPGANAFYFHGNKGEEPRVDAASHQ